jgi:hypothetical protein
MKTHPLIMSVLCGACLGSAQAQQAPEMMTDAATAAHQQQEIKGHDPARWHQEDATYAARLQTLRKEIGAALKEQQNACRQAAASARSNCLKEARATYEHDLRDAREQVMAKR